MDWSRGIDQIAGDIVGASRPSRGGTPTTSYSHAGYQRGSGAGGMSGALTPRTRPGATTSQLPPGTLNPATGQPFPPGTTLQQAQQAQLQAQQSPYGGFPGAINPMTGQPYPGMGFGGAINPMTGMPFPPGTTPMGMQAAYSAASGGGGYGGGGGGGGGGYAQDFGISDPTGGQGGGPSNYDPFSGMSGDDSSAYESYSDPMSQLGYWNT